MTVAQVRLGTNHSRILIYTTQKNLDFMENCEQWFCNGPFSIASPIYTKLFTIIMVYIIQM